MPNTPDLTAANVMDASAALLNDVAKTNFSYTVQIPYLNMALKELQEYFELNDASVVDSVSAVMTVPAGTTSIAFGTAGLRLPSDLIEPQQLWERPTGIDPYIPMNRVDVLPLTEAGIQLSQFLIYTWQSQELRFLACNQSNDIKMNYVRNLFATVTAAADQLNVINAASFLQFRTAALLAEFASENKTRATELNADASLSLDRALGINTKGRQAIMTRRRPFRASFKRRSYF